MTEEGVAGGFPTGTVSFGREREFMPIALTREQQEQLDRRGVTLGGGAESVDESRPGTRRRAKRMPCRRSRLGNQSCLLRLLLRGKRLALREKRQFVKHAGVGRVGQLDHTEDICIQDDHFDGTFLPRIGLALWDLRHWRPRRAAWR